MENFSNIYLLFVSAGLDIFKERGAPSWLSEHPAFEKVKQLKKVFPHFGLSNFEEKIKYESKNNSELESIIDELLSKLSGVFDNLLRKFTVIHKALFSKLDPVVLSILEAYILFLKEVRDSVRQAKTIKKDGKTKLLFDENIRLGGKTIFQSGASIFLSFNKINELTKQLLNKYPDIENGMKFLSQMSSENYLLPSMDSLQEVKNFHKINLPNKEYYVVFSSEGDEGAWDISTMSMRGISSCQSWDTKGEFKECLIGSILSRYVGIIYLTSKSDFEGFGSKMIKRSIVRFGITTDNEKVIIVDKMYDSYDSAIAQLFVETLQKRTNLRVLDFTKGIVSDFEIDPETILIPDEKPLQELEFKELPYKDIDFFTKHKKDTKYSLDYWFEIGHQVLADMNYIPNKVNSELADVWRIATNRLSNKLNTVVEKMVKQNVSTNLGNKYIKNNMIKYFNSLYDLDIESVLNLLFPSRSSWDIERFEKYFGASRAEIKSIFDAAIRQFKISLFNHAKTYFSDI